MGLGDWFGNGYSKAEDACFNFLDWLDEKGMPVYSVVTPLEDNGIPAFPVMVALLLVLGAALVWFVAMPSSVTTLSLALVDDSGASLSGVSVKVSDESGKTALDARKSNGE